MAYKASHKFARIAPRKARLVADLIRDAVLPLLHSMNQPPSAASKALPA